MTEQREQATALPAKRQVRLRLFAGARERIDREFVELRLPAGATIAQAREELARGYPDLAETAPHLHFAIGTEYASDDAEIPDNEPLVAFPPVGGG